MSPVPAGDAETSSVLALTVQLAPRVTLLALTKMAGPTVVANTPSVLTTAVGATVQVAKADRTVLACPARVTGANIASRLNRAVCRAAWEALTGCRVHLSAVRPHPALGANARSRDAKAMTGAQRVGTVSLLAKFPLVSFHADTLPVLTMTMSGTIWDLALLISDVALLALPAGFADALPVDVVALAGAEKRANTLAAVIPVKSRMALTLAKDTSSVSMAPVHTTLG